MDMKTSPRLFLVDDDPVYRSMYAHHLRTLGYTNINQFSNGKQCVDNLTMSPDIILLAHEMLPMNETDTLKKIRRFDPDIFVIYLSAQDQLEVAINALKDGAFDYVIKGSVNERQRLTEVLNKILDVRAQTAAKSSGKWNRFFSLVF